MIRHIVIILFREGEEEGWRRELLCTSRVFVFQIGFGTGGHGDWRVEDNGRIMECINALKIVYYPDLRFPPFFYYYFFFW